MSSPSTPKRTNPESSLERLLATSVRGLLGKRRYVVTLSHSMTVGEALAELRQNDILSAPVTLSPSAEDEDSGVFLGQIDLHTILHGVMKDAVDPATKKTLVNWEKLQALAQEFSDRKLITVLGDDVSLEYSGSAHQTELTHTLQEVILSGFLGGGADKHNVVHRVCIFNERGRISNIVTQSDIVQFIAKHTDQLDGLDKKTLQELGIVSKPALTVDEDSSVLDAFHKMFEMKHSAFAVVNKDGKLVDSISETDLRGLDLSNIGHLNQNVRTFLRREHLKAAAHKPEAESTVSPLACKESWHLDTVLHRLAATRVHRLWVVDDANTPIGVVSLTDIMRLLAKTVAK